MFKFITGYFQRKHVEKLEQLRIATERERQEAVDSRSSMSNRELIDEIAHCEKAIKELKSDYRVRRLAGQATRMTPLYHSLHTGSYYNCIIACQEVLRSRGATT